MFRRIGRQTRPAPVSNMRQRADARLFQLLVVVGGGCALWRPLIDPDLWWHLTVGRWIIAHRAIPTVDLWNQFGAGQPWRAYSWLIEILFAWCYSIDGVATLAVLKLILGIAILFAFSGCFTTLSRDRVVGSLIAIPVLAACADNFTLRPQSFSWIFFILVILLAHRMREEGIRLTLLAALFAVMALWANCHITTVFGVFIAFVWMLDGHKPYGFKRANCVGATALLGTLCTPYLGGEWMTTQSKALHPILHRSIAEFQPATILYYNAGVLTILTVLLGGMLVQRHKLLEAPRLATVGLFCLFALTAVKWIPYAAILLGASIATVWGRCQSTDRENVYRLIMQLRNSALRLPPMVTFALTVILVTRCAVKLHHSPLERTAFPVEATNFIETNELPHPILNEFGDGGYLMHRFSDPNGIPLQRVAIDGRTNVNDGEVMLAHEAAWSGFSNWHRYLDLVHPGTILWESGLPLASLLQLDPAWCVVYRDPPASETQRRSWLVFSTREVVSASPKLHCLN